MRTKLTLGLLTAGLALLGAILLTHRQRATQLREQVDDLRRQNQILASLQAEHQRLAEQQTPADELQRLRDDHEAVRRLRSEIDALKNRPTAKVPATPTDSIELAPASAWKNAGRATPAAAFESILWAATHSDVNTLIGLLNFQRDQRQLEALFAGLSTEARGRYGTPEKAFATLLAAQIPPAVGAMSVIAQESDNRPGPEQVSLRALLESPDGNTQKELGYTFLRMADGWRLVVPSQMVDSYAQLLTGATAAPAPAN